MRVTSIARSPAPARCSRMLTAMRPSFPSSQALSRANAAGEKRIEPMTARKSRFQQAFMRDYLLYGLHIDTGTRQTVCQSASWRHDSWEDGEAIPYRGGM